MPGADDLYRIMKYEAVDDTAAEQDLAPGEEPSRHYVGRVFAKPLRSGSAAIRLLLSPDGISCPELQGNKVPPDNYTAVLTRGLVCGLSYRDPGPGDHVRRGEYELSAVTLHPVDVEGEIRGIDVGASDEPATVSIWARPVGDGKWRHYPDSAYSASGSLSPASLKRLTRSMLLRLHVIPEYAILRDEGGFDCELWNFARGDSVRAKVVVGIPRGLLLRMELLSVADSSS